MSKPKKLDLPFEKLVEIAKAINENTLSNRNKLKENRIDTDKFIRQFNITRKDFSETIKDTSIKYNSSTFLYDFPEDYLSEAPVYQSVPIVHHSTSMSSTLKDYSSKPDSVLAVISSKPIEKFKVEGNKELVHQEYTGVNQVTVHQSNTPVYQVPKEFIEFVPLIGQLKEMLQWYNSSARHNENIIDVPDININNAKLSGEVITKSFKVYKSVIDDFLAFAEKRKETQRDLLSLALIEFIQKYDR